MKKAILIISLVTASFVNMNSQVVSNPAGFVVGAYPGEHVDYIADSKEFGHLWASVSFVDRLITFKNMQNQEKAYANLPSSFSTTPPAFGITRLSLTQTMVDADLDYETIICFAESGTYKTFIIDNDGTILCQINVLDFEAFELVNDKNFNYLVINNSATYIVKLNGLLDAPVYDTVTINNTVTTYDSVTVITHDSITVTSYDTLVVVVPNDTITVVNEINQLSTLTTLTISLNDETTVNGIDENAADLQVSVYPNPTSQALNIDVAEDFSNFNLKIVDMSGRVLVNEDLTQPSVSFDIHELGMTAGIYFLNFTDPSTNKTVTKKLSVN